MKSKSISFKLDSLDWTGGASDSFKETPLGKISSPLPIEEIAMVEWTIVDDNYITIVPVVRDTQIKYWLKLPEKAREKIIEYTQDLFPFEKKDITDRFLLAYSIEKDNKKSIGFIFESILMASKASLYVFTQADIESDLSAKDFLGNYINTIILLEKDKIESSHEEEELTIIDKIFRFFKFK